MINQAHCRDGIDASFPAMFLINHESKNFEGPILPFWLLKVGSTALKRSLKRQMEALEADFSCS